MGGDGVAQSGPERRWHCVGQKSSAFIFMTLVQNLVVPRTWVSGQPMPIKLIDLGMAQAWQAGGRAPRPPFAGEFEGDKSV